MKYAFFILIIPITLFSCINQENKSKLASTLIENKQLRIENKKLKDEIAALKFPASGRLEEIKTLIINEKYNEATTKIKALKELFPLSNETRLVNQQELIIANRIKEKKKEQERLIALGFKYFSDNTSGKIDNIHYTFSNFSFGRTFTSDYCPDVNEYSYSTSDKDNVYLLASLSLFSKDKNALFPWISLFILKDGKLKNVSNVMHEFATWTSYGAKIGNYDDDTHDFYKVNTIKYKIAAEITKEESKQVLFLIINKTEETIDNLTVEDVKNKCIVVKIMNKNKI